jgi:hypothetical protein
LLAVVQEEWETVTKVAVAVELVGLGLENLTPYQVEPIQLLLELEVLAELVSHKTQLILQMDKTLLLLD